MAAPKKHPARTGYVRAQRAAKPVPIVPYEAEEQMAVLEYCDIMHMPYFHVNNEMWTTSWKQKQTAKDMGTQSGVPDLFIYIPVGRFAIEGDGGRPEEHIAYQQVAVEMKRRKGSATSAEQVKWGRILTDAAVPHAICKGAQEAINFLKFAKQHYSKRWRADQDKLQSMREALALAMKEPLS